MLFWIRSRDFWSHLRSRRRALPSRDGHRSRVNPAYSAAISSPIGMASIRRADLPAGFLHRNGTVCSHGRLGHSDGRRPRRSKHRPADPTYRKFGMGAMPPITRGQEGGNLEGYGPYGIRGNLSINAVGQRGQNNNFLLDGMDNNDAWLHGVALVPPVETIESVSLDSVYIPAEYGRATGAVVNVQTRSGTNQLHGKRIRLPSKTPHSTLGIFSMEPPSPRRQRNQFGANLGGPDPQGQLVLLPRRRSSARAPGPDGDLHGSDRGSEDRRLRRYRNLRSLLDFTRVHSSAISPTIASRRR